MYVLAELAGGALAGLSAWPLYGTGPMHGKWHDMPGKVWADVILRWAALPVHMHARGMPSRMLLSLCAMGYQGIPYILAVCKYSKRTECQLKSTLKLPCTRPGILLQSSPGGATVVAG